MNIQVKQIHDKLYTLSIQTIILIGIIFRIRFFLTGRSLWLDEAMLALNIVNRSFSGLFQQPMEYGQSSPIGYLISVKAFTIILGDSEYALRLYSLIAGCLALILMPVISRKMLGQVGSFIAAAFFAFNLDLIYYTSETKQYISDVIATIIILFLLQRLLTIQATRRDFVILSIAGAVILWFSHAIVFVAAGMGIVLFLHYWLNKDWSRLFSTIKCGLVWGASLIILYIVNLRHLASSELLLNYWQDGFMEANPAWFVDVWKAFVITPINFQANSIIVFAVFIIGIGYLMKRNWQIGTTIILTLLFALLASGFHKYSLLGRMLLFLTPLFAITLGAGIIYIGTLFKHNYFSIAVQGLLAVYFIGVPLTNSFGEFVSPKYREHIKPTLEYLGDYKKDNDLIYVYYGTGPAFRFYAPKFKLGTSNYIIGNDRSTNPDDYHAELDKFIGHKRVWLIFSHIYEKDGFNEKDFILTYADQIGEKIREFHVSSTSVYLYLYDFQ